MTRPRILHLATRMNIGGPAKHVYEVVTGLADRFNFTVAAGVPPPEEGELVHPAVDVVHLRLVRSISPGRDLRAVREIAALRRSFKPRILHTHMAKAGLVGRLDAARAGGDAPHTVHTFHGHVLSGYFSAPVERLFLAAERRLARRTDRLIAVSEEIRDNLLWLGVGRPEQWRVVPLGFDLRPFTDAGDGNGSLRAELRLPDDLPLVGSIGRLAPVKNHQALLDAMTRLPEVHLVIVGDGPSRAEIERTVKELGLGRRVHLLGWRSDIPAVLGAVDVVALTSRNEGTPVSLIEAGAAGVPVVATDVGGVRSVVLDRRSGIVVEGDDPDALVAALTSLLGDPERRSEMGRVGRRHVTETFSRSNSLRLIAEVYEELLQG